jgi:hypothetical protein
VEIFAISSKTVHAKLKGAQRQQRAVAQQSLSCRAQAGMIEARLSQMQNVIRPTLNDRQCAAMLVRGPDAIKNQERHLGTGGMMPARRLFNAAPGKSDDVHV